MKEADQNTHKGLERKKRLNTKRIHNASRDQKTMDQNAQNNVSERTKIPEQRKRSEHTKGSELRFSMGHGKTIYEFSAHTPRRT